MTSMSKPVKGLAYIGMLCALGACSQHSQTTSQSHYQAAPYTSVESRPVSPLSSSETTGDAESVGPDHARTGYFATRDLRSIKTIAMDQAIVEGIKHKLEAEPTVEPSKILVYSYNGVVRLMGTTVDREAAQRVIEMAAATENVNKVMAEHLRVTHVGITLASKTF